MAGPGVARAPLGTRIRRIATPPRANCFPCALTHVRENQQGMVAIIPSLIETDSLIALVRDADGSVRAALTCWSVAISAFIILRVPREVLLACVIAAMATVGLAATLADLPPDRAAASASKPVPDSAGDRPSMPLRGLAAAAHSRE